MTLFAIRRMARDVRRYVSQHPILRAGSALLGAWLLVHELRYLFAFGYEGQARFGHHGLGYVMPAAGLIAALVLGRLPIFVAAGSSDPRRPRGLVRLWVTSSAAILSVYVGQELLEGVLVPGHSASVAGMFGAGGWVAVPLAFALGGVISLIVRVVDAVSGGAAAPPHDSMVLLSSRGLAVWRLGASRVLRGRLLADHLAGRGAAGLRRLAAVLDGAPPRRADLRRR